MNPQTMMMIAQGAIKAGREGSRLLQPKFKNTRYGKMLREQGREGLLSQAQEKNILDKVGTTAGKNAQLVRNRYIGSAINRGMGGSVAVQRGLREAEADVRRTVTDTARGISAREERAKSTARQNYARAMDRDTAERRQAGINMALAGLETAGNLIGAKAGQQQAKDQSYMNAVDKFGASNIEEVFSPETGRSLGFTGKGLSNADKRAIESFKQKNNVPDRGKVMEFLTNSQDNTELEARLSYARLLYPELFSGE